MMILVRRKLARNGVMKSDKQFGMIKSTNSLDVLAQAGVNKF